MNRHIFTLMEMVKKAKIWLNDFKLAKSTGFTARDLRRITGVVSDNQELFLEAWDEFFN